MLTVEKEIRKLKILEDSWKLSSAFFFIYVNGIFYFPF